MTGLFMTFFSPSHFAAVAIVPGQISLEEFIDGAERDPWVMDQLKLDLGPCKWFMEQQQKKKPWPLLCHLPCLDTTPSNVDASERDWLQIIEEENMHCKSQEIFYVWTWGGFQHFQGLLLFVFYLPPPERMTSPASYTLSFRWRSSEG